jgi:predicted  nucleic acid-binding Zn-ribbon protein
MMATVIPTPASILNGVLTILVVYLLLGLWLSWSVIKSLRALQRSYDIERQWSAYGQELREFRGRLNVLRQKLDGERKLQALRRQLAADNDHDPTYYGYPQSYYDEVAELEGWFHELEATRNRLRQLSN